MDFKLLLDSENNNNNYIIKFIIIYITTILRIILHEHYFIDKTYSLLPANYVIMTGFIFPAD